MPLVTDRAGRGHPSPSGTTSARTPCPRCRPEVSGPGRRYTFVRWAGQRDPEPGLPSDRPRPADARRLHGDRRRSPWRARSPRGSPTRTALALGPGQVSQISLLQQPRPGGDARDHPARPGCPASWPVYRDSLLSSHDVQYSVQSVLVGGTNVVHAGCRAVLSPARRPTRRSSGYFHALTITAHDALFGGGVGQLRAAHHAGPDRAPGAARDRGTPRPSANLPQGEYQVDVKAGGAIVSALTRAPVPRPDG